MIHLRQALTTMEARWVLAVERARDRANARLGFPEPARADLARLEGELATLRGWIAQLDAPDAEHAPPPPARSLLEWAETVTEQLRDALPAYPWPDPAPPEVSP